MAEVIAGIVLAHPAEAVEDLTTGQHRLDAEAEVAGAAMAQDADAPGIGREQATDPGRAFGGERQWKGEPLRRGQRPDIGEDRPRLRHHQPGRRIEVTDAGHALEGDEHRHRPRLGDLAADETGAAGIGNDPDPRLGAEAHGGGDFLRAPRQDNRRRLPVIAAPRLLQEPRLGRTDRVAAQQGAEACDECIIR